MAQFLHLFETENEFQDKRTNDYFEPWVSLTVESNDRVDYNKSEEEKRIELLGTPLTLEMLEPGHVIFRNNSRSAKRIEYSLDSGATWTEAALNNGTGETYGFDVAAGDNVQLRGNNQKWSYAAGSEFNIFVDYIDEDEAPQPRFNLKGNIMSLINSTNFSGLTSLVPATGYGDYVFFQLFAGNEGLINVDKLMLPATSLTSYCYYGMFSDCVNLITTPDLPATDLGDASSCYMQMFAHCTSLVNAPVLPATVLASQCYSSMFSGCTSLVNAPALPATTLEGSCYYRMFAFCTSLVSAPDLPAQTLPSRCYSDMFNSCSNLNYVKCLATTIGSNSTYYFLINTAANGTFVKDPNMTWQRGYNGVPDGWVIQDAE